MYAALGGAEQWALQRGITPEQIASIREHLLEN